MQDQRVKTSGAKHPTEANNSNNGRPQEESGPDRETTEDARFVSVIVPAYNVEKYFDECLYSLSSQTFKDFEVIIVDDGSSDDTAAIARRHCDANENFRYIYQPNSGLSVARNTGLDNSRSRFICFVDSDDYVSSDFLELLVNEQKSGGFDIVSARFVRISDEGEALAGQRARDEEIRVGQQPVEYGKKLLGLHFSSIACNRIYRKSLFEAHDLRFIPRRIHEDLFFTYKIFLRANSSSVIGDETYYYRARPDSLSTAISRARVDTAIAQWYDGKAFLESMDAPHDYYEQLSRRTLTFIGGLFVKIRRDEDILQYMNEQISHLRSEFKKVAQIFLNSGQTGDEVIENGLKFIDEAKASTDIITRVRANADLKDAQKLASNAVEATKPEDYFARPPMNFLSAKPRPTHPAERMGIFRNAFFGHRCFIIGNGPSLNDHDLNLIQQEFSFGVNSFFYKTRETGFRPTFFVVEDNLVMKENIDNIISYDAPVKFFPSEYRDLHPEDPNVVFFNMDQDFYRKTSRHHAQPRFSHEAESVVYCGQTVTYINLQLAYYMGFTEVYLIGMDFDYTVPDAHIIIGNHIKSTTDDPNHFHKDYFGKGKTWKDPKLENVAASYDHAKTCFEAAGRKVYNATIGGKLEIFPRINYDKLLIERQGCAASKEHAPQVAAQRPPDSGASRPTQLSGGSPAAETAPSSRKTNAPGGSAARTQLSRPFYASFGAWLLKRNSRLFGLLKFVRRALAGIARRRMWTLPALLTIAAVIAVGFTAAGTPYRTLLWGGGAFALAMFSIFYLGLRVYQYVTTLSAETAQLRNALVRNDKNANNLETTVVALDRRISTQEIKFDERIRESETRAVNAYEKKATQLETVVVNRMRKAESEITKTKAGLTQNTQSLKADIKSLEIESLSLDILSAMRALRPLWLGGSAVQRLKNENGKEHGQAIFMAALADEERRNPGMLSGKVLIEIGTTRELRPAQKSTQKLAIFAAATDMRFITVDMDPKNTNSAKWILSHINPAANAWAQRGEHYLRTHVGPLDYVYLDAFDFDHGEHSAERQERYQSILHTNINDEACWLMHKECAEIIIDKMPRGGIVALDDTWLDAEGAYLGKGKLAAPLLLANGFEIVASTKDTLCLKRALTEN